MTIISASKPFELLNEKGDPRLPSATQRWSGRSAREILPGLLLISVMTGASLAIRMLPGTATFSPQILSMVIGIAYHSIVGAAAWAKQRVTFGFHRRRRIAITPFGLRLTSNQVIEIGRRGLGIIAATVPATLGFSVSVGKLLGIEPKLALIAAGTSIFGASAIIATNTVPKAFDDGAAYSVTWVTVGGSVAMFTYPLLRAFGT